MNARSVKYRFSLNGRTIALEKAEASLAIPYPSESLEKRVNMTGVWAELEDKDGSLLYRRDVYVDNDRESSLRKEYLEILMPNLPEAAYIAIYAPPAQPRLLEKAFGAESVDVGRFSIPKLESVKTISNIDFPYDICGDGKGLVLGMNQIKTVASSTNAYNLIFLADNFGDDQSDFITVANKCCDYLYLRPPFSDFIGMSALNVWVVKISTNSGMSYFDTSYFSGSTHVSWDADKVNKVCDTLFSYNNKPFWNWAAVANTQSILRYDFAYYKNILWIVKHTADGISVAKYSLDNGELSEEITETKFRSQSDDLQEQITSSMGCTV